MRTIVVGDIHGCFDELGDLLSLLSLQTSDRVVCVGDLIVKGPKNREVLELFRTDQRFSAVLGNQDRTLMRRLSGENVKLKESQLECVRQLGDAPEQYASILRSMPLLLRLGSYLVVHAGVRPAVPLYKQSVDDLTELRSLGPDRTSREGVPWYHMYSGKETVIFGHWPSPEPRHGRRAIGIDTGCVYGHRLTCFVLETGELISVPSRKAYDVSKRTSV